jgi:F-type H+-transporting ATPase subunit b
MPGFFTPLRYVQNDNKYFMDGLISTFHIDVKLIIAQVVNFVIVLAVLYKFAYKPILKALNDRTQKIEKGLQDAETAGKKVVEMENREKEVIAEARKEAQKIIKAGEEAGNKNKQEILAGAKEQSEKIMKDAERKIEEERKKMMAEIKSEVAELVISATGKIIDEKLDAHKDKELIEKAIR